MREVDLLEEFEILIVIRNRKNTINEQSVLNPQSRNSFFAPLNLSITRLI